MQRCRMFRSLFSPDEAARAVREARAGPYVAGARVSRPWLRLLAVVPASAVLMLVAAFAVGLVLAIVGPVAGLDLAVIESATTGATLSLDQESGFMIVLAGVLIALALTLLGAAMIVYRRGPGAFLWPRAQGSWGLLAIGFMVMGALSLVLWPVALWLEPTTPPLFDASNPLADRLVYAAVAAGALLVAALAEEIAFRGVLLRVTASLTQRVWLICLLNGLLFSAIHLDPDPVAFVARALSGVVWAWAAVRLGGIAFAVGAHWANNLFIALLLEPLSSAAMPGQDIPPEYLGFEVLTFVVVLVAVELLARRRKTDDLKPEAST